MHSATTPPLVLLLLVTGGVAADTVTSHTNRIVLENSLQGSPRTEWDVNGAGNPDIAGFTTRSSLLPGATVRFKIWTRHADEPLRVDVYRLGWYGGDGARLVGRACVRCAPGRAAGDGQDVG